MGVPLLNGGSIGAAFGTGTFNAGLASEGAGAVGTLATGGFVEPGRGTLDLGRGNADSGLEAVLGDWACALSSVGVSTTPVAVIVAPGREATKPDRGDDAPAGRGVPVLLELVPPAVWGRD